MSELQEAAQRLNTFIQGRKRYSGRERIMAVDGSPLYASDLELVVASILAVCDKCGRVKGCTADCEDMNCEHCYCYREGRDG